MNNDTRIIIGIGDGANRNRYLNSSKVPKKTVGCALRRFVKKDCSYWYNNKGRCELHDKCLVLDGKPCDYFERSVLVPVNYRYKAGTLLEDPAFEKKVRAQYAKIKAAPEADKNCCRECGVDIPPKKKRCQHCAAE
ncbi:MAG: hypothetical protein JSW66_03645 [Phycisphaerales bacterium]|nr:MAG: hypothetical protein JSW66_03645 [Phycisphaerales bacterium]